MKIYQELYGFYFLFILLGIALAGLATALFLYKSRKSKSVSQQVNYNKDSVLTADDESEMEKVEVKFPETDVTKGSPIEKQESSKVIFKPLEVDDIPKPPSRVEETTNDENIRAEEPIVSETAIISETVSKRETFIQETGITLQNPVVSKTEPKETEVAPPIEKKLPDIIEIKPIVQKAVAGNVKQREFQERYQIIKERLADQDKFAMAHKELVHRANSIKKELVLFRQVINSESNDKIVNQVAKLINKSLIDVEKDVKAVPVLVELSQNIIPRMITEKLNEYESIKSSGVNVDKRLLSDLRGMATELVEILSKIKKIELEGLLEELMGIAKKLDKMSVRENMR